MFWIDIIEAEVNEQFLKFFGLFEAQTLPDFLVESDLVAGDDEGELFEGVDDGLDGHQYLHDALIFYFIAELGAYHTSRCSG